MLLTTTKESEYLLYFLNFMCPDINPYAETLNLKKIGYFDRLLEHKYSCYKFC